MLLQVNILTALILGLLIAWVGGTVIWFAALAAWGPDKGSMKRGLWSAALSLALVVVVVGIDVWNGFDELVFFTAYLNGCFIASVPAVAYLVYRLLRHKN